MELISVIVPCYNEQESLPLFYKEITAVTDGMKKKNNELEFEYIFVNDGSKDNTLKLLRELAPTDSRVRYISFSRNFGKEAAMLAGMEASKGDYVVILDADLQHPRLGRERQQRKKRVPVPAVHVLAQRGRVAEGVVVFLDQAVVVADEVLHCGLL